MTPHHNTGARFVAQSNVKRLMIHRITSTGMGANSTSVRLRKGKATKWNVSLTRRYVFLGSGWEVDVPLQPRNVMTK